MHPKIWSVYFMTTQVKHSDIPVCPCKFQGYVQQIRAVKPHGAYYIVFPAKVSYETISLFLWHFLFCMAECVHKPHIALNIV